MHFAWTVYRKYPYQLNFQVSSNCSMQDIIGNGYLNFTAFVKARVNNKSCFSACMAGVWVCNSPWNYISYAPMKSNSLKRKETWPGSRMSKRRTLQMERTRSHKLLPSCHMLVLFRFLLLHLLHYPFLFLHLMTISRVGFQSMASVSYLFEINLLRD